MNKGASALDPGTAPTAPTAGGLARLILAISVGAAVVLTSPFVGHVRDALRRSAGANYALVLNVIVLGTVAVAGAAALFRIRHRRLARYGAIAAAILAGAAYVWANALPGVERFHFVEYGLVTFLFYRALLPRGSGALVAAPADVSLFVIPTIAALIVGTADEWVQWFVPRRYGEVRDIFLNAAAIGCGLLFSAGAQPPSGLRFRLTPRSLSRMASLAAAAVLALGAFLWSVHLGYRVEDGEIGAFRSRHTAQDLLAAAADRTSRWGGGPPPEALAVGREDQYFTEGIWHVQARNEAWARGAVDDAWRENRILERYFAPVVRAGHAWPTAQRADAAARRGPDAARMFESRAERYPILAWDQRTFVAVVLVVAAGLLAINFTSSLAPPKRRRQGGRWC